MKENTLDILMYLFEHCLDEDQKVEQDESLLKGKLKQAGFAQNDINKAFIWLEDLAQQRTAPDSCLVAQSGDSCRIFSAPELAKLDKQCRGFLLALESNNIIDPFIRELIIERAMALEMEEIVLERFRWIIMMVMANQPGSEKMQTWLETLIFDRDSQYVH